MAHDLDLAVGGAKLAEGAGPARDEDSRAHPREPRSFGASRAACHQPHRASENYVIGASALRDGPAPDVYCLRFETPRGEGAWPESGGVCSFPRPGSRLPSWSSCAGSSSSDCSPTARTWRIRRCPGGSSTRTDASSTPAGISRGPAGLPAQRAHGVRLGVRPRRLPRARLHRRLPAPRLGPRQALATAAPASDSAARRTIKDFRTNRYDETTETLTLTAAQAAGVPPARPALQPVLLRPDDRARAARRGRSPTRAAAPADRLLRLDGLGGVDEPARAQLFVHEQLAARSRASTTSPPRT